jgi:molecular chaperone DnaK (HSP70)
VSHWAIDLGTTNTGLARWNPEAERAELVVLPEICRDPEGDDPLQAPGVVPSATHLVEGSDLWTRLGRLPVLSTRAFWGRHAWIGRQALERNVSRIHPAFAPGFKPHLQHQALRPVARIGRKSYTARDVTRAFLRELLAETQRATGERIRTITVTAPVDAYEGYRAEVRQLFRDLGVRIDRFVDEPVAAAAGYGLSVRGNRTVLVVDMGGGTTDLALIEIDAHSVESGEGRVLAKAGRPIAGNLVDQWMLQHVCSQLGTRIPEDPFWNRLLLDEARSVKERLFLNESELFHLRPPDHLSATEVRLLGADRELEVRREELIALLEHHGLYDSLRTCTDEILQRGRAEGLGPGGPDDVLMVGGSTLLPGVFPLFEERFGRDRVRAWQPFHAVVSGACTLSARGFAPSDYIVHSYAIVVYDQDSGKRYTTSIVPAGTRFPTRPDLWRQLLVPTCQLGEPERIFKLVVCEIGRAPEKERSFGWDEAGNLHRLDEEDGSLVVPLNESNPALGFLDPPHHPGDRSPRLDVRFGVDEDRWLVATVIDLKTQRTLMNGEPVVRLL